MNTFMVQCKYEMLRQIRNRRFFFFTILLPIGFYFIFSSIYGNAGYVANGVPFKTYYMISMGTFGLVGGAINGLSARIAFERTQGWMRLIQTTPMRNWRYVASKVLGQMIINLVTVILVFCAGAIKGATLTPVHWVLLVISLTLASLPFIALGILIGVVAGAEAAQIVGSGVYFILSILGGLWMPVSIFSPTLQNVAHVMPTYRMADLAWSIAGHHSIPGMDYGWLLIYFAAFFFIAMRWMKRRTARLG